MIVTCQITDFVPGPPDTPRNVGCVLRPLPDDAGGQPGGVVLHVNARAIVPADDIRQFGYEPVKHMHVVCEWRLPDPVKHMHAVCNWRLPDGIGGIAEVIKVPQQRMHGSVRRLTAVLGKRDYMAMANDQRPEVIAIDHRRSLLLVLVNRSVHHMPRAEFVPPDTADAWFGEDVMPGYNSGPRLMPSADDYSIRWVGDDWRTLPIPSASSPGVVAALEMKLNALTAALALEVNGPPRSDDVPEPIIVVAPEAE